MGVGFSTTRRGTTKASATVDVEPALFGRPFISLSRVALPPPLVCSDDGDAGDNDAKSAPMAVPSRAEERKLLSYVVNSQPAQGETWYVLHRQWFRSWKAYALEEHVKGEKRAQDGVKRTAERPGAITNRAVAEPHAGQLLSTSSTDVISVPPVVWTSLARWYRCRLPVPRPVVRTHTPDGPGGCVVELRRCLVVVIPVARNGSFSLADAAEPKNYMWFPPRTPAADVARDVCHAYGTTVAHTRLWLPTLAPSTSTTTSTSSTATETVSVGADGDKVQEQQDGPKLLARRGRKSGKDKETRATKRKEGRTRRGRTSPISKEKAAKNKGGVADGDGSASIADRDVLVQWTRLDLGTPESTAATLLVSLSSQASRDTLKAGLAAAAAAPDIRNDVSDAAKLLAARLRSAATGPGPADAVVAPADTDALVLDGDAAVAESRGQGVVHRPADGELPGRPDTAAPAAPVLNDGLVVVIGIEGRCTDGSLPRDYVLSGAGGRDATNCANWRRALRIGDRVDAADCDGKWFESLVLQVTRPQAQDGQNPGEARGKLAGDEATTVTVHFRGWQSRWDQTLKLCGKDIAPLHTKVPNWRDFRVNDRVEAKYTAPGAEPEWCVAVVREISLQDENDVAVKAKGAASSMSPAPDAAAPSSSSSLSSSSASAEEQTSTEESGEDGRVSPGSPKAKSTAAATRKGETPVAAAAATGGGADAAAAAAAVAACTWVPPVPRRRRVRVQFVGMGSGPNAFAELDADSELMCRSGTHCNRQQHRQEKALAAGRTNKTGKPPQSGAVGLSNLGNTCFMNSMIQCLSNVKPLTVYFTSGEFAASLNTTNKLGMGGRLAEAYASLMRDMWGGDFTCCVPAEMKRRIGEYAPQFAGTNQQDSQELFSFLLDGLHEDLNLVKNPKYVESVESDGKERNDAEVAAEAWARHLQRNRSFVVGLFGGQLRSHVTCDNPTCGKESITFDPFTSVSVPVPGGARIRARRQAFSDSKGTTVPVTVIWANDRKPPARYCVHLPATAKVAHLKEWIEATTQEDMRALHDRRLERDRVRRRRRERRRREMAKAAAAAEKEERGQAVQQVDDADADADADAEVEVEAKTTKDNEDNEDEHKQQSGTSDAGDGDDDSGAAGMPPAPRPLVLPRRSWVVADVYGGFIYELHDDAYPVHKIRNTDNVFIYELLDRRPSPSPTPASEASEASQASENGGASAGQTEVVEVEGTDAAKREGGEGSEHAAPGASSKAESAFKVGDRVRALWNNKKWYRGEVVRVHRDEVESQSAGGEGPEGGTSADKAVKFFFDVAFDDGDALSRADPSRLRLDSDGAGKGQDRGGATRWPEAGAELRLAVMIQRIPSALVKVNKKTGLTRISVDADPIKIRGVGLEGSGAARSRRGIMQGIKSAMRFKRGHGSAPLSKASRESAAAKQRKCAKENVAFPLVVSFPVGGCSNMQLRLIIWFQLLRRGWIRGDHDVDADDLDAAAAAVLTAVATRPRARTPSPEIETRSSPAAAWDEEDTTTTTTATATTSTTTTTSGKGGETKAETLQKDGHESVEPVRGIAALDIWCNGFSAEVPPYAVLLTDPQGQKEVLVGDDESAPFYEVPWDDEPFSLEGPHAADEGGEQADGGAQRQQQKTLTLDWSVLGTRKALWVGSSGLERVVKHPTMRQYEQYLAATATDEDNGKDAIDVEKAGVSSSWDEEEMEGLSLFKEDIYAVYNEDAELGLPFGYAASDEDEAYFNMDVEAKKEQDGGEAKDGDLAKRGKGKDRTSVFVDHGRASATSDGEDEDAEGKRSPDISQVAAQRERERERARGRRRRRRRRQASEEANSSASSLSPTSRAGGASNKKAKKKKKKRKKKDKKKSRKKGSSKASTEYVTLERCLERFTRRERLDEHNAWYCNKCKEHRRAYKKFDLWSLPEVLVINLKRFHYQQGSYVVQRDKIETLVEFPAKGLDLSPFLERARQQCCSPVAPAEQTNGETGLAMASAPKENMQYDLVAVSNHVGGMGGGHYTAQARNFNNGRWYEFNDSIVTQTSEGKLVSNMAYVLFYKRRSSKW